MECIGLLRDGTHVSANWRRFFEKLLSIMSSSPPCTECEYTPVVSLLGVPHWVVVRRCGVHADADFQAWELQRR